MTSINFKCPYCSHPTTITDPNYFDCWQRMHVIKSDKGDVGLFIQSITCPNKECQKLWLRMEMNSVDYKGIRQDWNVIHQWQLLPESEAMVLSDYIPQPIQQDYYEACRIRDLSPKASATLARRCLQGMIRDFWEIKKSQLKDEIDELKDKVDPDVWESIDAVRSVGNIGAHMEKDINIIVDVEPGEAQLLIGLIEQLVDDWYVARESRKKRTEELKRLVANKEMQKK
ncbi:MAG: hypothetical protein UV40_C0008G0011 [Parcubacteria group bacterium GW2011_GWA1_42_7]|nr:MAG: hypothetical protein UV34_C0004G0014 [Parcubacteria group bacterium GW2011_GWB1_42_6]KKS69998.1 MAG: hypothetical protein UV40_C0008G0011 [Parcubacteria group bacterium GW2011_GWA1_42_7]